MSLDNCKVVIRSRTRGKNPQAFSYTGWGRLVKAVNITDADGNELLTTGEPASREGEGKASKAVLKDGESFLMRDIVSVEGITDSLDDVLAVLSEFVADQGKTAKAMLYEAGLLYANDLARELASPAAEEKEDYLAEIVSALVANDILVKSDDRKKDTVGTWRRMVTQGANATAEGDTATKEEVLAYVENMKQVKKLRKLQAAGTAK